MSMRFRWFGKRREREIKRRSIEGLMAAAQHVLAVSNSRIPLDEGHLMRSGGVDVDEQAMKASVYYTAIYAPRQHEELDWNHAPGREAKFLEKSMIEQRARVREIIAEHTRRATRG